MSETVEEAVEERPTRRRGGSAQRQQEVATTQRTRPVPTPRPVSNRNAWHIPPIQCYEPDDGVFYAQMGPTGGKRGYPAITGNNNYDYNTIRYRLQYDYELNVLCDDIRKYRTNNFIRG